MALSALHTKHGEIFQCEHWVVRKLNTAANSRLYRAFLLGLVLEDTRDVDGILLDGPVRVNEWALFGPPIELTKEAYDAACLQFIKDVQALPSGTVWVNASTLWAYERWGDIEVRDLIRESVRLADAAFFESGGAWTFGELSEKDIFIGKRPAHVYVGEAAP